MVSHDRAFLWSPRGFENSKEHDEAIIKNWNSENYKCFFKLDKKLVEILKSNYSFDSVDSETSTTIVPEITDINKKEISSEQEDIDSNYKEMYDPLKEEKDASDLLIEDLVNNLIEYKEKYGDIKSE